MDILAIQRELNLKGFGPLKEDGKTGNQTKEAVKRFQKRHGLVEDGVPGEKTLSLLFSACADTEIKTMSDSGLNFLINEEGLRLKPYKDSVGIATIGVGCTFYEDGSKVRITDKPITRERAVGLFKNVLKMFELTVYSTTRDDLNQNQFNALVSLCFNIGVAGFKKSSLLKLVNHNPHDPQIREAFLKWSFAGGKPILKHRRSREADLYFTTC